jgi:hypothetical protein
LLYGAYFFLSDEVISYQRDVENLIAVLAKFGGIFALANKIFLLLGYFANERLLIAKYIRTIYL